MTESYGISWTAALLAAYRASEADANMVPVTDRLCSLLVISPANFLTTLPSLQQRPQQLRVRLEIRLRSSLLIVDRCKLFLIKRDATQALLRP